MMLDNLNTPSTDAHPDDPPNLTLILAKRMKGEDDASPDALGNPQNEQDRMEASACKAMMSAAKSDDARGFRDALCDFLDMYQMRDVDGSPRF